MKTLVQTMVAACALAAASTLSAAPIGTLSFVQPTGVAKPNDSISIWLRFTLDSNAAPLIINGSAGGSVSGIDSGWFDYDDPENPYAVTYGTFTSVNTTRFQTAFGCSGTFTNSCDPGAYDFVWNSGANSIFRLGNITLNPGESIDYLWGSFVPQGTVAAGTYEFYYSELKVIFTGTARGYKFGPDGHPLAALDDEGQPILDAFGYPVYELFDFESASGETMIGVTDCPNSATPTPCAAAFTRTVSAVPVPGAVWSFGSALLGLSIAARRRSRRTAQR